MKSTLPWFSPDSVSRKQRENESDYEDKGCGGLCTKSLECPFPRCIYDTPGKPYHKTRKVLKHFGRPLRGRFITCVMCGGKRWCRPYVIKTYAAKYCGQGCMAKDPEWRGKVGFNRGRKKLLIGV